MNPHHTHDTERELLTKKLWIAVNALHDIANWQSADLNDLRKWAGGALSLIKDTK